MRLRILSTIVAAVAVTTVTVGAADAHTRRHAHLVKSDPMADSTVAAPVAVRLWFSERVDVGVSAIKLVDASDKAVKTGALRYDGKPGAASPVVATIATPLAPGTYRVRWAAASGDGHPVRGEFTFHVRPAP